jgi:PhnB protein
MIKLTPFLLFDGNCAEAMEFYQSCLGGELTVLRVADTPMKGNVPEELHQRIAHARLKSGAVDFSAVDWLHPTRTPRPGNTVAMYVNEGRYEELKAIFDRLVVDADRDLVDELREMPFGAYGHLADKFGIHWFFQGSNPASIS